MISSLFLLACEPGGSGSVAMARLRGECIRANISITETMQPECALPASGLIVVAGGTTPETILDELRELRRQGHRTIFALDTTDFDEPKTRALADCLESERFHFKQSEAILYLLESANHFVYAFPKADVAASVAVVFARSYSILLVRRKREPFKGMLSLPGGFLRPLVESLPECAARELHEESGLQVSPQNLVPLSIRSNPNRDTRGHVIDQSYLAVLNGEQEDYWLSRLHANDDAAEVVVLPLKEALLADLAADHKLIVQEAARLVQPKDSIYARVVYWISSLRQPRSIGRTRTVEVA